MAKSGLQRLVPQARPALCRMLNPHDGALEAPIRSELFGLQRFAEHGASLAQTHHAVPSRRPRESFFPRLQNNIVRLRAAFEYISIQANAGYDISPAAEWLVENFHLLEAQFKEVSEGLPLSYFRTLPILVHPPLSGMPRVYALAWAFVAHTDGAFDEDLLVHFLKAYQEHCELNLSELWALPTTLRVVLMENLRRLAERVAANKGARELANLCCDQLESYDLDALDQIFHLLQRRGVGQTFLAQMTLRLQDKSAGGRVAYLDWARLALPDFAALQAQQRADQAADNLSVSNAVTALRAIGDADWSDIVTRTSPLMGLLLTSTVFAAEHTVTRDSTLHAIELLARNGVHSEIEVGQALLQLMSQRPEGDTQQAIPSYWLLGEGRGALNNALGQTGGTASSLPWWPSVRLTTAAYLGALTLLTVGLVGWLLWTSVELPAAQWIVLALVLPFPISEAVLALINRLVSESSRPRHLHRLALTQGIPAEHKVLVVIPCMLGDHASIGRQAHRLRLHYLANLEEHAQFALLSDWLDAPGAQAPGDAALLACARAHIADLNRLHPRPHENDPAAPARFILLHRPRTFSTSEQAWIGWERKRGKLELLVDALATGQPAAFLDLGPDSQLELRARYIVTLDSDSQLPPGRLRDLVGVAAHPYNQPRLDASGQRVVSGYGILQPRVVTPLPAAHALTPYHWLFAGQFGLDPYSAASSEVYQDLFGEGIFTGKGLLNVSAVHATLSGRLPNDRVLSHDLLEGALARCGSVTDIPLLEDSPFHADVAASRLHRWTRGDWQLLPFIWNARRHGISILNVWKMADNLRRSLVAPASLLLVLTALAGSSVSPWLALTVVFAAYTSGALIGAFAGFVPSHGHLERWYFLRGAGVDLARALGGGVWQVALLLQSALLTVDAIARALFRMVVSKRHLLQWKTAASAELSAREGLYALVSQHWGAPLAALILACALVAWGHTPVLSVVLCAVWGSAPLWIWLVSRNIGGKHGVILSNADQDHLRGLARDTWRFFERTVTAADNHLPPDNLQVTPTDMVAHRTSPTNIGLYMLSTACARELGWISTTDLLMRVEATLGTLLGMQRHRGHFLNWYDTQSLAPLLPTYVSTVDSGNLCAHLLCVAQACRSLAANPDDSAALRSAMIHSHKRLQPFLAHRTQLGAVAREELRWLLEDHRALKLSCNAGHATLPPAEQEQQRARLRTLSDRLEALAWEPDFRFLYHPKRHLLHIGYRPAEQQLDASFYDLLASEARLTSLIAIAKGDIPVTHWAALGRMFCVQQGLAGMRSWSGSMFEYLMPGLVIAEPAGSVLADTCAMALREQMAFAAATRVPWGMSESAYAARDQSLAYQYAPQGVPRLALRRTPAGELVIAPYACVLAAQIAPQHALTNLQRLEALGARQRYGLIESLDYSPARQTTSGGFIAVGTFMAHHQGMSIAALSNLLRNGVVQRWGMANPQLQAIGSVLHERTPREISRLYTLPSGVPPQMLRKRQPGLLRAVKPGEAAVEPTHLLSNGRYSVALRANGAGRSRWGDIGISRWRDDLLRDAYGHFMYLNWLTVNRQGAPLPFASITQNPAPDPKARYESTFHADRICFHSTWPQLTSDMTVWVSPEDDIEFRRVELCNRTTQAIELEVISAFELTLSEQNADEAHPAFTGMFVLAHWHAGHQALVFARKPRIATESAVHAAHFLAQTDHPVLGMRVCAARPQWLGRNRSAASPAGQLVAMDPPAGATDTHATVDIPTELDPACVLAARIRIAPNSRATLTFATAVADNADIRHAVMDKYHQPSHVQRASLMSATLAGIRLRALNIGVEQFAALQSVSTALLWSVVRPENGDTTAPPPAQQKCDRRLLWRLGISGDRPILLVSVGVVQGAGLLRSLAQALRMWAWSGVACDLVVLNDEPNSYAMTLQRELAVISERLAGDAVTSTTPTALHVLRTQELSAAEIGTLQGLARLHIHADGRPLVHHLQEWVALHEQARLDRNRAPRVVIPLCPYLPPMAAPKGTFDAQSGAYTFAVGNGMRTSRPWSNVLANPDFGSVLTETGGGFTWATNSRLHQITPWSNDPVSDPSGESFFLQDTRTDQAWSLTPNCWADPSATYQITHGQGITTIRHRRLDVDVTLTWCVDTHDALKSVQVAVRNTGERVQRLRLVGIVEWIMGANRQDRNTCQTSLFRGDPTHHRTLGLLCQQRAQEGGFGDTTAFWSLQGPRQDTVQTFEWTCDRREFFDRQGRMVLPQSLEARSGRGLDPCAALSVAFHLEPDGMTEFSFSLGHAPDLIAASAILEAAAGTKASGMHDRVVAWWQQLLGAATVRTPDPLLDVLANHWFLYQAVACRMWAKAGFYQAGGATGFRDQLQDAMALAWAAPHLLREQLVLCASRQFAKGDVQHWWHAPTGVGVRTHFSDDLLWLPHALAHYLHATGDMSVMEEEIPFLEGQDIPPDAEDAYFTPTVGTEVVTLWEHAARTIDASLRVGIHGLPLMGSGDWNDGMNSVGREGRGESVWLGWFLSQIIAQMAPLARARQELERAMRWETAANLRGQALLENAWDGAWFCRAYFDGGQALGASANSECRIDLIAQAWSVLSGAAPLDMQATAMDAADSQLVDPQAGLVKLLAPPLQHDRPSAGYIQAYPPGVRENGGQYAHAGVWALMAQAHLHTSGATLGADGTPRSDLAYRYFTYLSPAHRDANTAQSAVYGLEPYAMAGDVYGAEPYLGRGGWSWYTGSAGLMHRGVVESIFGLRQEASSLCLMPCLPTHWDEAELTLRRDGKSLRFILHRTAADCAQEAAKTRNAEVLEVGAQINWQTLADGACYLVPLPMIELHAPA